MSETWHVMVYRGGYGHATAVHIFTDQPPSPEDLHAKYPLSDGGVWYAGYERLPLNFKGDHVLNVTFDDDRFGVKVKVEGSLPEPHAQSLLRYRSSHITLDFDYDSERRLHDALERLQDMAGEIKCFKTYRGHHIRAKLLSPISPKELISKRGELQDDLHRIEIDQAYMSAGLPYLTNFLFHRKAWKEGDSDKVHVHDEVPVDPRTVMVAHRGRVSLHLPQLTIPILGGELKLERRDNGTEVYAKLPISSRRFQNILRSIEDNFWEYQVRQVKGLRERLVEAYGEISPWLAHVVSQCEIRTDYNNLILHVPKELTQYIGRLIGKQGANVNTVAQKIGVRIKITSEEVPETIAIKQKLDTLLKTLV